MSPVGFQVLLAVLAALRRRHPLARPAVHEQDGTRSESLVPVG